MHIKERSMKYVEWRIFKMRKGATHPKLEPSVP